MTSTLPGADIRGFYDALGIALPEWAAVEASVRCFADPAAHAHEDRDPSCSVNLEIGAWRCWGCGAKGGAYDAATWRGRSPREAMDLLVSYGIAPRRPAGRRAGQPPRAPHRLPPAPAPRQPPPQLAANQRDVVRWKQALHQRAWPPRALRPAHRRLWQRTAAAELDLGWNRGRITIPIRDGDGDLQGVLRYRSRPGTGPKMLAMPGTRLGLIPHPTEERSPWLVLVEGPPDLIAARSRGLPAIAVPGDHAWEPAWAGLFAARRVAVAMDCDPQGRAAAQRICADLRTTADAVEIVDVAPGHDDGYDLTDWLDRHRRLPASTLRALFAV